MSTGHAITAHVRRLAANGRQLYLRISKADVARCALQHGQVVEVELNGSTRIRGVLKTSGSSPWVAPATSNDEITGVLRNGGFKHGDDVPSFLSVAARASSSPNERRLIAAQAFSDPSQPVTLDNLRAGIHAWDSMGGSWGRDFEAAFYSRLAERSHPMTEAWWNTTLDDLARWRATRGQPKDAIRVAGRDQLDSLSRCRDRIIAAVGPDTPVHLDVCQWTTLSSLFVVAQSIKQTESPVFASKLCHFIFPDAFPVMDHEFTGVSDYPQYWQECCASWKACEDREQLLRELRDRVNADQRRHFPWQTKIVELCVAGRRKRGLA